MIKMRSTLSVCALALLTSATAASGLTTVAVGTGSSAAYDCAAAKNKIAGKYAFCHQKAEARAITTGAPVDHSECDTSYARKWARAETNGGGMCPSQGDQAAIQAFITEHTDAVAAALAGVGLPSCGDNVINVAGEQCDGTDLGGETCGTLGFPSGSLACASCRFNASGCEPCGGPRCGDNVINAAGEQCDGTDLGGETCATFGFAGGSLACASCRFDTSDCTCPVPSVLPASGQTTAHGTGSDGDVEAGAALSYTDNGDGTITDNVTGLMWEKKDDSGGIHDWDNTYTWCAPMLPTGNPCNNGTDAMDGSIVTTFLSTLNADGGFAGHTDWRIPNYKELTGILNLENFAPTIAAEFHQSATCIGCTDVTAVTCSCTGNSFYWSSTTYQGSPSSAAGVDFYFGLVIWGNKSGYAYVRAVRGGL